MEWVACTEAYVLVAMPTEVRTAYDKWLVTFPSKAGRLGVLGGQVVEDFRRALGSNPNVTLEDGDDLLPKQCVPHAMTVIFYHLMLEMGVAVNLSAQTAFSNAQVYLRRLYVSDAVMDGAALSKTPSYVAGLSRVPRVLHGTRGR